MRLRFVIPVLLMSGVAAVVAGQSNPGGDWPQWRGPDRTGVSRESGLMRQWPPAGPSRVWSIANLGPGYGSMAINGDRIFVQARVGSQSAVLSLNRADGKIVWSRAL